MIWYFTGTGNSKWVAEWLGERLMEPVQPMTTGKEPLQYTIQENEKLIFVFPVHSWGPPVLVRDFVRRMDFLNVVSPDVYAVCTCGDDCGDTHKMMKFYLSPKRLELKGCFSVQMPNNYILFPGFDVDSKEIEKEKLAKAPARLEDILSAIGGETEVDLYVRGSMSFIKSRVIQPLFVSCVLGKTKFHVKRQTCISCGKCEKMCPTGTIRMEEEYPQWGNQCIQCLACFHRCPVRAIEYGKISLKKGRYVHPEM